MTVQCAHIYRLISGCDDGQIRVYFWSAPTGASAQLGSPLRAHSKAIVLLAISPDSQCVRGSHREAVEHPPLPANLSVSMPMR
jgi:WD40 repeat protein